MPLRRARHPALEVELPITPMLDMTFQLLVFFILTFRPQALEGQMNFALPSGSGSMPQGESAAGEVELPPEWTVMVKTVRDGINDGSISQLIVCSRTGEHAVADLKALGRHLKQINQGLANEQATIQISTDSTLKYACLIQVMDVCRQAGFRVGFAPPADVAHR